MSNDGDHLRRTTDTGEPVIIRREEVYVTRGANTAVWWIAALMAVVAIVGVIFRISNNNTQAQLQAAHDQGAAQAGLENATTNAQIAASQASVAAQTAATGATRANESAAQAAADRAAAATINAQDAAQDATTTEPAQPPQ